MTTNTGKQLTSNQYWGGLNRRFDNRVARLYSLGYRLEGSDYGSFMVKRNYQGIRVVPMSMVMHCPNAEYHQFLRGTLAPSGARRMSRVA